MKYKLFKRFFTACMIVLAVCFVLVAFFMNDYVSKRNSSELASCARLVAMLLNEQGEDIPKTEEINSNIRATLVLADGTVVYDSVLDVSEMENHANREEIKEALRDGTGESRRYSESILQKTVYYALKLENGNVLRVSMEADTLLLLVLNLLQPLALSIALVILLSLILAGRFSKDIMAPIDRIDLENPDDRDVYDEMKPFIRRIVSQNQQIYHQMNELREESSKQDQMRREFTANVSHELKTPLTSISGFAEIIRDGLVQEKDLPRFADTIYQEAQRLIVLVNDILKLSRLEEGGTVQLEEQKQKADLLIICREAVDRLAMSAKKAGITMTCEGESVEILCIRKVLEEIIGNVCDNAVKYNRPEGSVAVTVHREDNYAVVRVKDTGIGIPEEDRVRIFERFYRVNKSHSKEVGGTGLGLSIVKHGLALHRANMTLESEVGKGTEFVLYFPAE